MNKEEIQFDKLIREKLEDFSVPPSPHVWSGIAEKLSGRKRQRTIVFYRIAGIAAALLIAFVAGWYYYSATEVPGTNSVAEIVPEKKDDAGVQEKTSSENNSLALKTEKYEPERNSGSFKKKEGTSEGTKTVEMAEPIRKGFGYVLDLLKMTWFT